MTGKASGRRRHPLKYAVIAGLVAVVSVALIEATGSMMTSSYSGLGGKVAAPTSKSAPASAPAR